MGSLAGPGHVVVARETRKMTCVDAPDDGRRLAYAGFCCPATKLALPSGATKLPRGHSSPLPSPLVSPVGASYKTISTSSAPLPTHSASYSFNHTTHPLPRPIHSIMAAEDTTAVVVDETPISPVRSLDRRNSLEKHLQHRPEPQDLKNRHILLDTTTAPYVCPPLRLLPSPTTPPANSMHHPHKQTQ